MVVFISSAKWLDFEDPPASYLSSLNTAWLAFNLATGYSMTELWLQ